MIKLVSGFRQEDCNYFFAVTSISTKVISGKNQLKPDYLSWSIYNVSLFFIVFIV